MRQFVNDLPSASLGTMVTTTPAYSFRDAELESPALVALNWIGARLAAVGLEVPTLTSEGIVRAAQKRAGSGDLGGDSFREPLDRYLQAVREEADLNLFGKLAVKGMLVESLRNRIDLARWAREHPDVRDERIEAPFIIVGLPRTGTSLLSILLGLDPNARTLMHWEAAQLIPPPSLATAAEDPRIAANAKQLGQLLKLNPAIGAMHPFGATIAQECVALFMLDVRTLGVETQAHVPSYGRWLEGCDMTAAYAQHKLALQALQAAQPTDRWVLKSPNHLWCLDTLLESYPNARIIWTHRDPGKVITSLASLVNSLQRMFTKRRDHVATAEEWLGKSRFAIESGMAFDDRSSEGWCQHVRFEDLMRDPIGAVRAIYAQYGEAPTALHVRRMEVWMRERGRHSEGRHVYDPKDFGWTYDELAEEFSAYRGRYDIPRE
jgi:hypothetical protein